MPRLSTEEEKNIESQRLKKLRESMGLSQRKMAKEFGVSPAAINQWEKKERSIPGPVIKLISLYEEKPRTQNRTFKTTMAIASYWGKNRLNDFLYRFKENEEEKNKAKEEALKDLMKSFGELKGLTMKIGQSLSSMNLELPLELKNSLAESLAQTNFMSAETVNRIFQEDFGCSPNDLFDFWDSTPFATASIGQVHRAKLNGKKVAVKVQYPDIFHVLNMDLKKLDLVDELGTFFFKGQKKGAAQEFKEVFLSECDYQLEAKNQQLFKDLFKNDDHVYIPEVYLDHSSKRVLTSELMVGQSFYDFAQEASSEEKNKMGEVLWNFYFTSLFQHGIFHADPQQGNFLFKDGQVVILDFGCVKSFSATQIQDWKDIGKALFDKNFDQFIEITKKLDFYPHIKSEEAYQYWHKVLSYFHKPLLTKGSFPYTKDYVKNFWRLAIKENPYKFESNMPSHWIFVNRLQWGLYSLLTDLEADFDHQKRWFELIKD